MTDYNRVNAFEEDYDEKEDFNLDSRLENSGSGFAIEDDIDVESMLNEADAYSEKDDDDFIPASSINELNNDEKISQNNGSTIVSEYTKNGNNENNQPIDHGSDQSDNFEQKSLTNHNDSHDDNTTESYSSTSLPPSENINSKINTSIDASPTIEVQGNKSELDNLNDSQANGDPVNKSNFNEQSRRTVNLPTSASEVHRVQQVIQILDAYRSLNGEQRVIVSQFINSGETIENEPELIVSVLNVDKMLTMTIKALREAKGKDSVERVFYVIELPDDVFYSLGALLEAFGLETIDTSLSKTQYARELVKNIDTLDVTSMKYIEATELVLAAAEVSV